MDSVVRAITIGDRIWNKPTQVMVMIAYDETLSGASKICLIEQYLALVKWEKVSNGTQ